MPTPAIVRMETPRRAAAPGSGANGYAFVQEATKLRDSDLEMRFAAAVITLWPKQAQHEEHLRRAVAGAEGDPLLASNRRGHRSGRSRGSVANPGGPAVRNQSSGPGLVHDRDGIPALRGGRGKLLRCPARDRRGPDGGAAIRVASSRIFFMKPGAIQVLPRLAGFS
ncbi:MAG: hypothetical protein ABSH28_03520 [Acidobacteriota bacterium]